MLVLLQILSIANSAGQNAGSDIQSLLLTFSLIMAPLIVLTGPFDMAGSFVMRNWARDEHADLSGDYKSALRSNRKQGLLFGLTGGIMLPLFTVSMIVYPGYARTYPFLYIPAAITSMMFGSSRKAGV